MRERLLLSAHAGLKARVGVGAIAERLVCGVPTAAKGDRPPFGLLQQVPVSVDEAHSTSDLKWSVIPDLDFDNVRH